MSNGVNEQSAQLDVLDMGISNEDADLNLRSHNSARYPRFHFLRTFKGILFIIFFLLLIMIIFKLCRKQEIEQNLEVKLVTPETLESLCNLTTWKPNIFLNCTNMYNMPGNPPGTAYPQGLINTKVLIFTCLRWAVDAGMGFVLPRLASRNEINKIYFDHWENFNFLFDEDYLRQTIKEKCPQLSIINSDTEIVNRIVTKPGDFKRHSFGTYREHAANILQDSHFKDLDTTSIVIWENETLFGWIFDQDSFEIRQFFRNAIKFSPSIRVLSAKLVEKISSNFIGFHLRGEKDTYWNSYDIMVNQFLRSIPSNYSNVTTIYVSIGDFEVADRFRKDMTALSFNVMSKWTLASEDQILFNQINLLKFDQLAILDYEILMLADFYIGSGGSSFTYAVAYERGKGDISKCACDLGGPFVDPFKCCY